MCGEPLTIEDVISVNLTGSFVMMQAVGRHMLERSRKDLPQPVGSTGSIINISSTGGKRGDWSSQLRRRKIRTFWPHHDRSIRVGDVWCRCNTIGFGAVVTPMTEVA